MKKFVLPGIVLAIGFALAIVFVRIISAAVGIVNSFVTVIITNVIVTATLLIVFWMFAYASKKK